MAIKYKCPNCQKLWIEQTRCSCGTLVDIKPLEVDEAGNIVLTSGRNGYDRYLDFQYSRSGHFMQALFTAIMKADTENQDKLAMGFPEEVEAYRCWTRIGVEEFARRCGNKHSALFGTFCDEYGLEGLSNG